MALIAWRILRAHRKKSITQCDFYINCRLQWGLLTAREISDTTSVEKWIFPQIKSFFRVFLLKHSSSLSFFRNKKEFEAQQFIESLGTVFTNRVSTLGVFPRFAQHNSVRAALKRIQSRPPCPFPAESLNCVGQQAIKLFANEGPCLSHPLPAGHKNDLPCTQYGGSTALMRNPIGHVVDRDVVIVIWQAFSKSFSRT